MVDVATLEKWLLSTNVNADMLAVADMLEFHVIEDVLSGRPGPNCPGILPDKLGLFGLSHEGFFVNQEGMCIVVRPYVVALLGEIFVVQFNNFPSGFQHFIANDLI